MSIVKDYLRQHAVQNPDLVKFISVNMIDGSENVTGPGDNPDATVFGSGARSPCASGESQVANDLGKWVNENQADKPYVIIVLPIADDRLDFEEFASAMMATDKEGMTVQELLQDYALVKFLFITDAATWDTLTTEGEELGEVGPFDTASFYRRYNEEVHSVVISEFTTGRANVSLVAPATIDDEGTQRQQLRLRSAAVGSGVRNEYVDFESPGQVLQPRIASAFMAVLHKGDKRVEGQRVAGLNTALPDFKGAFALTPQAIRAFTHVAKSVLFVGATQ